MRIDHLAFRVKDRHKTAQFFISAFNYKIQDEFEVEFDDGSKAKCIALEPPEKVKNCLWKHTEMNAEYHMAPEIFVSDGEPDSIIGRWVAEKGGIGGVHHIAYQVDSVKDKMTEWKEKGYAEFTSEEPMTCPGLTQCFTKPSELTGVIYEFIERDKQGFCRENVKKLMTSTKDL